ncbi:MAG: hypothetical protein NC483_02720 [Ruminococcus sp.]|nr:hypothetical protein [Ruminococcus sp.]
MKFERNRNSKRYFLCGLISAVVLTITVTFITSKANYRMTASIPLTEGKVISSPYDFNIVAMYIDGIEQSKETTMPGKGYVLTSDSYCYKGSDKNNKDTSVILETNKYGEHIISELSKSSKCILYFKRREATTSAASYILSHITEMTHRKKGTFNQVIEGETTGKIYADRDDDGVTYYYAGNPTDNWVEFGGYYWRIIRINGDGTIRMIYQGTESNATGEGTQIGTSSFNVNRDDNAYVGFMYGAAGSITYEATHENINDSTIKQYLYNWYENNTLKDYEEYIDKNAGFCVDKSLASGNGYGNVPETRYSAYIRIRYGNPSYTCNRYEDLFTVTSAVRGNRKMTYPIGLITGDEAIFAGFSYTAASMNYLNNGLAYWTISPGRYNTSSSNITAARNFAIRDNYLGAWEVRNSLGVRPVINLRSDVTFTGDGTIVSPYKVIS